jgi:hypothetical protein
MVAASDIPPDVIRRFVEQHRNAVACVERLGERQAARTIMTSPFVRIITYSVLDGWRLIAVDFAASRFELDDDLVDEVERTRVSFEQTFDDLFGRLSTTTVTTNAQMNVTEKSSHQIDTSVMATFDVAVWRRLIPFVSGGGGWSSTLGDGPSFTLSGNYIVQPPNPLSSPINETDTVTIRFEPKGNRPFADLGGGVRIPFSARSGLRVDVRARIQSEGMRTVVSADPVLVARTPQTGISFFSAGGTSLLFQTFNPYTNSTLSGVDLENFETFSSSETRTYVNASVGWFWRF